ncbi:hypothetical protein BV898_04568 [Hypsibius exemplaris]|uniref:Uncharacterized protein n=1 Tax=Hypsibius exemplaris TaxID=2072580 RepID=A0A1W0X1J3_HYPEX|nr:hypothetical protein BV898_04568 [Hypsibius exemplaris]
MGRVNANFTAAVSLQCFSLMVVLNNSRKIDIGQLRAFPHHFRLRICNRLGEEAADDNPQEDFLAANARFAYSLRRETVAFHPIPFDDMYSIDKRGNTLHFVDDATSIAKLGYPISPA